MGALVYVGATSHVGAIIKNPAAHPDRSARLDQAWRSMAAELERLDPDVVILIATDHYETFGLEHYPIFCLGTAESHEAWGEFGNPSGTIAGAREVGHAIHAGLVSVGFDVAHSQEMALDHSFMVPIVRLGLTHRRIVPLFVNCNTPPLPTLERCRDLGRALRQVIEGLNHETKVAVVATGGVSHWVGLPRFGDVNEEWDHDFLGWLASGDLDAILALSDEDIVEAAGNGALEVRTWVAAMACAGGDQADVLAYEPMPDWGIGIGIMRMVVAS